MTNHKSKKHCKKTRSPKPVKNSGWELIGLGNNLSQSVDPKNDTIFECELLDQNEKPSGKFKIESLADGTTKYKFRVDNWKGCSDADSSSVPIIYVNIK